MLDDDRPSEDQASARPPDGSVNANGDPNGDGSVDAPPSARTEMTRLDPRARSAQWISDVLVTLALAAAAIFIEQRWLLPHPAWPLVHPWIAWIATPLLLLLGLAYPPYWYRAWGYSLRENDLLVCHGVLWRVRRAVPRRRIQHADIQSGPIDRWFGLCSLTLYTAGSGDEDATIPGLTPETAEAISDQLLRPDDPPGG